MSLRHDAESWVAVFTRDTGGWVTLHPLARFVSLELTRKLDRHGELSLGRRGLPALAGVLHAEWNEIEPHVRALLEDGRLVYDEARRVISDPQHARRQDAARSSAGAELEDVAASSRGLSLLPGAVRARRLRAKKRAQESAAAQLPIAFTRDARRDARDAYAHRNAPSRLGDLLPHDRPSISADSSRDDRDAAIPLSLSSPDHDLINEEKQESARTPDVTLLTLDDARTLPDDARTFAELGNAKRVTKGKPPITANLGAVWSDFVLWFVGLKAEQSRRFPTRHAVLARWSRWVEYERAEAAPEASAQGRGPSLAKSSALVAEHRAQEREAAPLGLAAELAAALASGFQITTRRPSLQAVGT